ncbi:hypothetical protein EDD16DRAFT_1623180 [Pisolithus croceorrhizus]|nr:hypothetical protein EV401DRAFT_1872690 [Pisolithus croceorrhizus]KAI6107187.1 hypothetical protein EDD16DRAFT_1623180 [Pisolithus croceorrhizus]KAI6143150.1 hypothetical protein EDD17DRAFT_1768901 [Pisolithus thermaeus]
MSTSIISRLHDWPRYCLPRARKIALGIIKANAPLSTQDIFRLANGNATAQPPSAQVAAANTTRILKLTGYRGVKPPFTGSQIRSVRYLKKVVLPSLANDKEIEKFHTKIESKQSRTTDVWLWRVKDRKQSAQSQQATTRNTAETLPPGIADLPPAAVGVGEDWSHLNKRRQRAREKKVERDLKRMMTLQDAKREAARELLAERVSSVSFGVPSSRGSRSSIRQ